jgi:hypothetical protein
MYVTCPFVVQGLYPLKDYMHGLEASLEAVANRVQSLEEVVLLLRQTTDLDPDPAIHRVRWDLQEGKRFPIPWQDSISRPIAPVSSAAGGDNTTRPRRQSLGQFFKKLV